MSFEYIENQAQTSTTDFSIELDRICSFQELYNSMNKMTMKPDWNFIRTDHEVVIYKIKSVFNEVPKLSVIIKISVDLSVDVWVEEVALDVKSTLWKLLGYNFIDDQVNLRYSMLLELIRFLDGNQLLVTNRRQKWHFNADDVTKAFKSDKPYCRICFKVFDVTQMTEIDDETIHFVSAVTQIQWLLDESLSKSICNCCLTEINEIKQFQSYISKIHSQLNTILNSDMTQQESDSDQLVLIRAQYDIPQSSKNASQVSIDSKPVKIEATYDEEWLLEEQDEVEETRDACTIEVFELSEDVKFDKETHDKIKSEKETNIETSVPVSRRSPVINSDGKFECPHCPKMYPAKATLNKHIYRVHTPSTEECPICHKLFNPYKLQCHMHFHKLQHKCELCDKSFPHPSNLANHIRKKHSDTPLTYPCSICGCDLTTKKLLNSHLLSVHGYVEDNGNKTPVECDYCGRQYQSKSSIHNHFRRGCDQNPYATKPEILQCRVCNIEVGSSSEMTHHMRTHTTRYVCELCKARFTHKVFYQKHMEKHTNQSRPFQCDTCGASYSRIEHVRAHIARTHNKDFKQKCQYCNKGFISINELRDHERIHTNERPFVCTMSGCENTFRTKAALKSHLIRHTNYHYPCKYCYKKFRNINNLVSHCKKVHQDSYKSDDEIDFVPVVMSNADETTISSTSKDELIEVVFVTSNEEDTVAETLQS